MGGPGLREVWPSGWKQEEEREPGRRPASLPESSDWSSSGYRERGSGIAAGGVGGLMRRLTRAVGGMPISISYNNNKARHFKKFKK